jgi:hypothetical protein
MNSGVAVAIHLPKGVHVAVGFDTADTKWLGDQARVATVSAALCKVLWFLQDDMLRVLTRTGAYYSICALEPFERDLLTLVLEGLSSSSIQQRTKSNARQLVGVFDTITQKLCSPNRWQAAARAYQAGLLC